MSYIYRMENYFSVTTYGHDQVLDARICHPLDIRNRIIFLGYRVADSRAVEIVDFKYDFPKTSTEDWVKPGMYSMAMKPLVGGNITIELYADEALSGSPKQVGRFSFPYNVIEVNITLKGQLMGPGIPQNGEIGPLKPLGSGTQFAPGPRCGQRLEPNESVLFGLKLRYTTGIICVRGIHS